MTNPIPLELANYFLNRKEPCFISDEIAKQVEQISNALIAQDAELKEARAVIEWYASGENLYEGPLGIGEGKLSLPMGTKAREFLAKWPGEK